MTKADVVHQIAEKTGIEKTTILASIETFMGVIKSSMESGKNVYLRGFGSFVLKTRAEKIGRNITKNVAVKIPAHSVPSFKPAKSFAKRIKSKVKVKK
jgi:DNA-binding protein HU-beta